MVIKARYGPAFSRATLAAPSTADADTSEELGWNVDRESTASRTGTAHFKGFWGVGRNDLEPFSDEELTTMVESFEYKQGYRLNSCAREALVEKIQDARTQAIGWVCKAVPSLCANYNDMLGHLAAS